MNDDARRGDGGAGIAFGTRIGIAVAGFRPGLPGRRCPLDDCLHRLAPGQPAAA